MEELDLWKYKKKGNKREEGTTKCTNATFLFRNQGWACREHGYRCGVRRRSWRKDRVRKGGAL